MTEADAQSYLQSRPRFGGEAGTGYRPGLARIEALLCAMGQPHEAFPSVHVAGTNGKGSTASMVAAIATASGRRAGLHTSPHFTDLTERMRIDGQPASWTWLAQALKQHHATFEQVSPTLFEATVALSLLYFAERRVDVAIVEVGLGGRLDATNVLRPEAALITHIGRDHMHLLGDTLAAIAREKAGIIKPGIPVLVGSNAPAVREVLRKEAQSQDAPLHVVSEETRIEEGVDGLTMHTPHRSYESVTLDLRGEHQQDNALLALRAAELLWSELPPEVVRRGLGDVKRLAGLRGRGDILQRAPLIMVDVAHNPDGVAAALRTARAEVPEGGRLYVLLGLMRDKAVAEVVERVSEARATVIPVGLGGKRALTGEALAQRLREVGMPMQGPVDEVGAGIDLFRDQATAQDGFLIVGSHQLAASLFSAVQ